MRRLSSLAIALVAIALVAGSATDASARKKTKKRDLCVRTAAVFKAAKEKKRFNAADVVRKLDAVFAKDRKCKEAPREAYDLLVTAWTNVLPETTKAVPRGEVRRQLDRFWKVARAIQAIVRFHRSGIRARAALALGKVHEAMSLFLQHQGDLPETLYIIRESRELLYDTRAVDLREYLLVQAEKAYRIVVATLRSANPKHKTLVAAKRRLKALEKRHEARKRLAAPTDEPLRKAPVKP